MLIFCLPFTTHLHLQAHQKEVRPIKQASLKWPTLGGIQLILPACLPACLPLKNCTGSAAGSQFLAYPRRNAPTRTSRIYKSSSSFCSVDCWLQGTPCWWSTAQGPPYRRSRSWGSRQSHSGLDIKVFKKKNMFKYRTHECQLRVSRPA